MGNFFHRKRKLNCTQVEARLIEYVKGGLSTKDAQAIRDHIATCERCTHTLHDAEALEAQLATEAKGYRPTLSREASARVQGHIYQRMRRGLIMQRTWQLATRAIGLIIVIGLIIGVLVFLQTRNGSLTSASDSTQLVGESDAKVVITFADYEYRAKVWEPIIEEFNRAHSNIKVQFVLLSSPSTNASQDLNERLKTIAASADVIGAFLSIPETAAYTLDLTSFFESDPEFDASDFWPGTIDACRINAFTFGLPLSASVEYVFFDSAAFDAVGLPYPQPGWTLDEFQLAARALTQHEGDQVTRYGFATDNAYTMLAPYMHAILERTAGAIDATALAEETGWFADLVREDAVLNLQDFDAYQTLIADGRTAMWTEHQLNLAYRRNSLGPTIQIAPFPINATSANTNLGGVRCPGISAGTQHPNQAWTWLKFLTQYQIEDSQHEFPARISLTEASGYLDSPEGETARFALAHPFYRSQYEQAVTAISRAYSDALRDGTDLETAFAQIGEIAETPLPTPAAESIAVATPQSPSDDVQVVDYYSFSFIHPNTATVKELVNEFNRTHPEIQVKASDSLNVNQGETFSLADVAQQYDCFPWFTHREIINTQAIYSLDALIDADPQGTQLLADYAAQTLDSMRINGQLYALPAQVQPPIIYYNADHFAALDLQPPSLDWTFEDFLALAAAATSAEGDDKVYGFVPFQGSDIEFFLAAYNIRPYDLTINPPILRLDAPETIAAFTQLTGMFDAGIMPTFKPDGTRTLHGNYSEREGIIVSGHAAMWTDLAGLRGGFVADQDAPFKIGYAPLPRVHGSIATPPPQGFFISRRSADPKGCWEWIKFLSAQPSAFSAVPARRSVVESAEWEASVGSETAAAYRTALLYPEPFVQSNEATSISSQPIDRWLADVVGAVFEGADPATELPRVQHYAEDYVACMTQSSTRDEEQVNACAKSADPGYKTFQELVAEP